MNETWILILRYFFLSALSIMGLLLFLRRARVRTQNHSNDPWEAIDSLRSEIEAFRIALSQLSVAPPRMKPAVAATNAETHPQELYRSKSAGSTLRGRVPVSQAESELLAKVHDLLVNA